MQKNVLGHPSFKVEDVLGVNFKKIDRLIDAHVNRPSGPGTSGPLGWQTSTLSVNVPTKGGEPTQFKVPGFLHRSMLDIIRTAFSSISTAKPFHYVPFREFWQPPPGPDPDVSNDEERIYGELYTSEAFNRAHEELQKKPAPDGCTHERVIAAIMLWSDSTQLANFGNAKLWPIYMYLGNQSKYVRCRPTARAAHHLAYLPQIPDKIQDHIRDHGRASKTGRKKVITHCRRELLHEAWKHLLSDEEFLRAYEHGIEITCADGVVRLVFPRIFTYSADYPEKVLLATIRDLGSCPCPRCLVSLEDIPQLGTDSDKKVRTTRARKDNAAFRKKVQKARDYILKKGRLVDSKPVEKILFPHSLVPTENAFSSCLSRFGFDVFKMLVVDLMHEVELGVWKALLQHLIRILHAEDSSLVETFDERFRKIQPFGRDTIRRFHSNVSGLSKLAARDLEDILQCIIPAFDGLLRDKSDNDGILDLLFVFNRWHSLAKLRLHTDTTLKCLETLTVELGEQFRHFTDVICPKYSTTETEKEVAVRRAKAKKPSASKKNRKSDSEKQEKLFNLETIKFHALGDYVSMIKEFGTTDSYSTQAGELEHRIAKGYYKRVSRKKPEAQIARVERREHFHHDIANQLRADEDRVGHGTAPHDNPNTDLNTGSAYIRPEEHHHIGQKGEKFNYRRAMREHRSDPAYKNFDVKLQDHILARLAGSQYEGSATQFTSEDRRHLCIKDDIVHSHPTLRVNYTTYDLRREQDLVNNTTKSNIMLLSNEEPNTNGAAFHPYWYARILGIYHVEIRDQRTTRDKWERMELLWVRWYRRVDDIATGWEACRLDQVEYVPSDEEGAFGFVNPAHVLRGVHLLQDFKSGLTTEQLSTKSVAADSPNGDWKRYCINRFPDRDMMMRYLGGGVGHAHLDTGGLSAEVKGWLIAHGVTSTLRAPDAGGSKGADDVDGDKMEETQESDSEDSKSDATSSSEDDDDETENDVDDEEEDGGESESDLGPESEDEADYILGGEVGYHRY